MRTSVLQRLPPQHPFASVAWSVRSARCHLPSVLALRSFSRAVRTSWWIRAVYIALSHNLAFAGVLARLHLGLHHISHVVRQGDAELLCRSHDAFSFGNRIKSYFNRPRVSTGLSNAALPCLRSSTELTNTQRHGPQNLTPVLSARDPRRRVERIDRRRVHPTAEQGRWGRFPGDRVHADLVGRGSPDRLGG